MIALAACNNSAKKAKENHSDTTSNVVPQKDTVVSRILPDDGQVGIKRGAVFIFKNRGFELFSGGAGMGKKYAEVINI
jgi:hypothetical protein